MSDVYAHIRRYAERVESGEVIPPTEYIIRCHRLVRRGLSWKVVQMLSETASAGLLRQAEAMTPEQLRQLNEAAA